MSSLSPVLVQRVELEQFRVYRSLDLTIPASGLRIVGANGTGKSSIVDALLLLSTTRSRQGIQDGDLIRWGSGKDFGVAPYARVIGSIERDDVTARIEIFLESNPARGTTRKLLKVADRSRRAVDVVGLMPTVSFSPEDLDLVLGTPSIRRRWLDIVLSQADRKYLRFLSRYTKILGQRNGLLKQGENGGAAQASEFAYWDEQLTALGAYIIGARALALQHMAVGANTQFSMLAPTVEALEIEYLSTLEQTPAWWASIGSAGSADEVAQRVGGVYESRLRESFTVDLARGVTHVGPHRDDVIFSLGGRPLTRFGSRGQQRLAVVALKLAEADYIASVTAVKPVFMLDDVLSELDPDHRTSLIETVRGNGSQLVVTATETSLLEGEALSDLALAVLTEPGELYLR